MSARRPAGELGDDRPEVRPGQEARHASHPALRLQLKHGVAIGPGKATLLEKLRDTGSISAAGRALGMSYRRAWLLVESMNESFAGPLVESRSGGAGGGGARLTALGEEVLARYRAMEVKARAAIDSELVEFERLLADSSGLSR